MVSNITEVFVSFEIAKLLKSKGFICSCEYYYDCDGRRRLAGEEYEPVADAPTIAMAMRWLREEHNKHCDISFDIELCWYFQIIDLIKIVEDLDYPEMKIYHGDNDCGFQSYEDTAEMAIKYCLENLI